MNTISAQTFKKEQMRFERVREAFSEKENGLSNQCENLGVQWDDLNIFIRALKREEILQVWVKNDLDLKFKKLKEYPFSAFSGKLGPKRKQGDFQIPEGVYKIDRFNPASLFHLSLGINYPNAADKKKSSPPFGGDIFIHGDEQTIGCIPITDDLIREVYVLAVQAKNVGQHQIWVHIFPCAISIDGLKVLEKEAKPDEELKAFWKNLQPIYSHFEKSKSVIPVSINSAGDYVQK